ncbi:DUF6812 domain-containing protein [Desulfocicer niacini]
MEHTQPINREVDSRVVRLKLTDGTHVKGHVNLNRTPGYERVSDLVTENPERFLVLFSVSVKKEASDTPVFHQTLFINRDHILWAAPDEDQ